MQVIRDGIRFCGDCAQAAVNDDYSGLDARYGPDEANALQERIGKALGGIGLNLVHAGEDDGEGWFDCDCCGSLPGSGYCFVVLDRDGADFKVEAL